MFCGPMLFSMETSSTTSSGKILLALLPWVHEGHEFNTQEEQYQKIFNNQYLARLFSSVDEGNSIISTLGNCGKEYFEYVYISASGIQRNQLTQKKLKLINMISVIAIEKDLEEANRKLYSYCTQNNLTDVYKFLGLIFEIDFKDQYLRLCNDLRIIDTEDRLQNLEKLTLNADYFNNKLIELLKQLISPSSDQSCLAWDYSTLLDMIIKTESWNVVRDELENILIDIGVSFYKNTFDYYNLFLSINTAGKSEDSSGLAQRKGHGCCILL
jgi:hypothetical protein